MAPSFLRTLSQRLTGNRAKSRRAPVPPSPLALADQHKGPPPPPAPPPNSRRHCHCRVQLLDQTCLDALFPRGAMGQELYDRVFTHLDLEERDYFGLQFTDHFQVQHWLDPAKKIRKQVPIGPPYTFRFRVKFFSSEPANLREELTRYQFFLQLRNDIQNGKLDCPRDVTVELAALALQSEFGDFSAREHSLDFVSEFRFHPAQDEQMELDILNHFATKCTGLSPLDAELAYVNRARRLDFYGVDLHPVEGRDGNTYKLGLTPTGMQVFDGAQKIGLFLWEKIQRLDFRGKKLTLVVEEDLEQPRSAGQLIQLHTFVFELSSHKACKHLWKCAIEYHTFYRLKFHHRRAQRQNRIQLFRLGSTFRYRGRTEYESVHREELGPSPTAVRRSASYTQFSRRPSQRYAARQRTKPREELTNGGNGAAAEEREKTAPVPNGAPKMQPNGPSSAIPVAKSPTKRQEQHFVTTIQISRAQRENGNNGSKAMDPQTTATRIPKYVLANSTTQQSAAVPRSSTITVSPQRKCTQIPVIRTGQQQRREAKTEL